MFVKSLLFCVLLCFAESYKILAVFPHPSYSHYSISSKVVKELAKRGHDVTYITPYPQKNGTTENLKEISVETLVSKMSERKIKLLSLAELSIFENIRITTQVGYFVTEEFYKNENVQTLLKTNEQYDLVLIHQFLNEGLLGIAHHFKAPLVLLSSMPLFPWATFQLAHPAPSSYVPNLLTSYTGHMTFWQRINNCIYDAYSIIYHQCVMLPKHKELVKKYIPGEPDLYDFTNNASLLLINTHVSCHEASVQVPNVIEIGGIHLEEPKRLPLDLQNFLDSAKNGVVLFSMGSNLKSSALPVEKRDAILKAFSKLKQKVLWKWEVDELPGQPQNVKLMKWLPQSDILAHPNVRLFITHGGLLSTMESVYHGVPLIGIPIFADQKANMETAVNNGYAAVVHFTELSEEKLSLALNQVLKDPKYRKNIQKRSKIIKDRPIKPMDSAMYWIEYVLRHQGAPHLRYPGMDLNWAQRYLLDVIAFSIITILATFGILLFLLKQIFIFFKKGVAIEKKQN